MPRAPPAASQPWASCWAWSVEASLVHQCLTCLMPCRVDERSDYFCSAVVSCWFAKTAVYIFCHYGRLVLWRWPWLALVIRDNLGVWSHKCRAGRLCWNRRIDLALYRWTRALLPSCLVLCRPVFHCYLSRTAELFNSPTCLYFSWFVTAILVEPGNVTVLVTGGKTCPRFHLSG